MARHPIQPIELDERGTARFKANKIVQFLLDNGPHDMNGIAGRQFSQEDREQFAQLIGYSLSGASDLEYVRSETLETANAMFTMGQTEEQARIAYLESQLEQVKGSIWDAAVALFSVHPDDLK